MRKNESLDCPNCGHYMDNDISDLELDVEDLTLTFTCSKCATRWSEFYKLDYRGYRHRGETYDIEGYPDSV